MRLKLILFIALILGQIIPVAYAKTEKECPTHFYLGLAGGLDRMNGRRSEELTETIGGVRTSTTYTSNFRVFENNAYLSFVGGFLWKLPPLPILIGPEINVGRGNARSTVTYISRNSRFYSSDFSRKLFYGALLRIGYEFCHTYVALLSVGYDRSQFETRRYFAVDAAFRPTVVNRTRALGGYVLGLGLEKHFHKFIAGLDFKVIQYRRQQATDNVLMANAPATSNLAIRPVMYMAGLRLAYKF